MHHTLLWSSQAAYCHLTSFEVTFFYNLLPIGTSLLALSSVYRISEYLTVISKQVDSQNKKALRQQGK